MATQRLGRTEKHEAAAAAAAFVCGRAVKCLGDARVLALAMQCSRHRLTGNQSCGLASHTHTHTVH